MVELIIFSAFFEKPKEEPKKEELNIEVANGKETENMEGKNATDYAKELSDILPSHIKVGLLHGKMKNQEKDEVMERFKSGETQVLISTTVIEVGVDVKNATMMVIFDAHKFGLSTLHQLRGRVGRSDHQSYCILVSGKDNKISDKRNEIMVNSTDGFVIGSQYAVGESHGTLNDF